MVASRFRASAQSSCSAASASAAFSASSQGSPAWIRASMRSSASLFAVPRSENQSAQRDLRPAASARVQEAIASSKMSSRIPLAARRGGTMPPAHTDASRHHATRSPREAATGKRQKSR